MIGIAIPKGYTTQQITYNGHKRKHALKFQALKSPDGLIMHVHGPIEVRSHDRTMYTRSSLDMNLPGGTGRRRKAVLYLWRFRCNRRWFMEIPFQGSNLTVQQVAFNKAKSFAPITVEWIFKEVKLYFRTVDYKRKMKVFESQVGSLYLAGMLLSNIRNCIYRNQVAKYFKCTPPTLEDYLVRRLPT